MLTETTKEFNRASISAFSATVAGTFATNGPIMISTVGIFLANLTHQFHWTRTEFAVALTMSSIIVFFVAPWAGRWIDRWGARPVVLPAIFVGGLAMMAMSLNDGRLWKFYLIYAIYAVTCGIQNQIAYAKVISQWFSFRRGAMLAGLAMTSSLGYALMPQILRPIIAAHGWRTAYVLDGCVPLLLLVYMLFFLRQPKSALARAGAGPQLLAAAPAEGYSRKQALRTLEFWLLVGMMFFCVNAILGVGQSLFPMLRDRGMSVLDATGALSFTAVGGLIGQFLSGIAMDRLHTPRVAFPFMASALIGISILHYANGFGGAASGAALLGVGQGAELGIAAYMVSRWFGLVAFGQIYGIIFAIAGLVGGCGPLLMSMVYDHFGSYDPMLWLYQGFLVVGLALILLMRGYRFDVRLNDAPAVAERAEGGRALS